MKLRYFKLQDSGSEDHAQETIADQHEAAPFRRYRALQSLEHQVTPRKTGRPDALPGVTHVPISARRPGRYQQGVDTLRPKIT